MPTGIGDFGDFFLFLLAQQPNADQDGVIIEVSRSHNNDTPQSGILWTGDRPVAETST
jgi:hypothetical protein